MPYRFSSRAFVSAQVAIVLAIIALGCGLLAYEWRSAHHAKAHHGSGGGHHHHKKHDAKTTGG